MIKNIKVIYSDPSPPKWKAAASGTVVDDHDDSRITHAIHTHAYSHITETITQNLCPFDTQVGLHTRATYDAM